MKKIQIAAASMSLLLALGLSACSTGQEPTTQPSTDTPAATQPEQTTQPEQDTEPQELIVPEETPEQDTAPEVEVYEQQDSLTVKEGDYLYTLVQVAEPEEEGRLTMRVLHDYVIGETIDFRNTDLTEQQFTGEEFTFTPGEHVRYFVHDGNQWQTQDLSTLQPGDYVYLTCDSSTTVLYITATETTGEPQEAEVLPEAADDPANPAQSGDSGTSSDQP